MSRAISFEAETANYGLPDTSTAYYEGPVVSGANDILSIYSPWSDTSPSPTTPGTPQTPTSTSGAGCSVRPHSADLGTSQCQPNVPYIDDEIRPLVPRRLGQGVEWSDKNLPFGMNNGDPPHLSQATDSIYHERAPFEFTQWNDSIRDATSSKSVDGAFQNASDYTDFGCPMFLQNVATKQETIDTADLFTLATSGLEQDVPITAAYSSDVQYQPVEELGSIESNRIRPVGSDALLHASRRRRERNASYFCNLCFATFTAKHNLKNHMNSHRGIRPHMCQGCRRTFGTKHVLTRHEGTCTFFRNRRRGHWNASR